MIASKQDSISVNRVVLQDGLKIYETNNQAATGEEVL